MDKDNHTLKVYEVFVLTSNKETAEKWAKEISEITGRIAKISERKI